MITLKQGIKLSAIIDKLALDVDTTKVNDKGKEIKKTQEEFGADLMVQIISKAHKAEQEIYAFAAEIKGITHQEAESLDLIEFVKELLSDAGVTSFFKTAVK